jgi:hypothetical protein
LPINDRTIAGPNPPPFEFTFEFLARFRVDRRRNPSLTTITAG